jgi:cytochrome c biogenesis protein
MTTGGVPTSVYSLDTSRLQQLRSPDGEPLRLVLAPGTATTLPDGAGTVSFDGLRRYAALDVRYDPTKGWVLAAAVVALAGLMASLFVRRRRVWFSARRDGDGRTVVEAAALSRGDDPRLEAEVRSLLAAAGLSPPPAPRPADGDGDEPLVPAPAAPDEHADQTQGKE